jgi:hypothetical protein
MKSAARLVGSTSGAAAAELALVLPLLVLMICSCVEVGNFFLDEHRLIKAVRDGARYAARQNIGAFTGCAGNPGGTIVADTRNIVMTGLLSGGNDYLPNRSTATIDVTVVGCSTTTVGGMYTGLKNSSGTAVGAPVVEVKASVPYAPVMHAFGFTGFGLTLNASQQAAVAGW